MPMIHLLNAYDPQCLWSSYLMTMIYLLSDNDPSTQWPWSIYSVPMIHLPYSPWYNCSAQCLRSIYSVPMVCLLNAYDSSTLMDTTEKPMNTENSPHSVSWTSQQHWIQSPTTFSVTDSERLSEYTFQLFLGFRLLFSVDFSQSRHQRVFSTRRFESLKDLRMDPFSLLSTQSLTSVTQHHNLNHHSVTILIFIHDWIADLKKETNVECLMTQGSLIPDNSSSTQINIFARLS